MTDSDRPRWRPEVEAFADLMEARLRTHDGDRGPRGWMQTDMFWLHKRLTGEADELYEALEMARHDGDVQDYREEIASEAADVANFAMMIVDVFGALESMPGNAKPDDVP